MSTIRDNIVTIKGIISFCKSFMGMSVPATPNKLAMLVCNDYESHLN